MDEKQLDDELIRLGARATFRQAAFFSFCCSSAVSAMLLGILPAGISAFLYAFCVAAAGPLLAYFVLSYSKARREREIEESLPAALFQLASFPRSTPMEKVVQELSRQHGALGRAFAAPSRMLESGASVQDALDEAAAGGPPLLSKVVKLLKASYESGAELGGALSKVAEHSFELQAARKENAAAAAMQKYTVLAGGCLLVPAILGVLISLVSSLGLQDARELFGSGGADLLPAVASSAQAYVAIFSVIASVFLGLQDGNIKKAALYVPVLLPLSLLVFGAASTARLS